MKKISILRSVPMATMLVLMAVNGFCADLTVSAAMSLKNAFEDISKAYEETNKGDKLIFNFGGSGDLKKQIEAGAPVDVFASAAQKDMNELSEKAMIDKESRKNFASNSVVLIKPSSSKIMIYSFEDLSKPEVKKIGLGNPDTVPAGRYGKEVIDKFGLWSKIKDKTVLAENVRQVLDYVSRNEVDAGIVYETDAMTVPEKVSVAIKAPSDSHAPVIYPVAVVSGSAKKEAAKKFIDFLGSDKSMEILKKYGFTPVK